MNASCQCPSSVELRELLDGNASDAEQSAVVAHLDHCRPCQQSLEALANSDSSLAVTLQEQRALITPQADSAYWPALEKATELGVAAPRAPRPRDDVSLKFLDPPEDGSHLGMLNNFTITRMIGRGGMGVVLQATDTCLERDVAIKVLDPELADDELSRTRFCREARAAASISHENVVAVYQVEHEEGKDLPFLVMELITGESLETKIAREGRLSLRDIVRIGMQTAAGLAAAHDKNLIHRDIKPGNILLEQSGQRVKLTDFGLARAAEDVRLTRSGLVAGTPLYMSPEQATGDELDARSDLFSLGVVLYELAAGEPPFNGKTPLAVLKRLTEAQPQPLRERNPDLPEWFVNIVDKLLAKDRKDRFQSAREVASTFEHFWTLLRSSDEVICPKKRAANLWKPVVLGVAAGAVTLLLGAAAALFLLPRNERLGEKIPAALHTFKGAGPIWSMAISKDGKNLAVGTDKGAVRFWEIATERVMWTLNAHSTPIWTLALSPRGDYLATGSDDGHAKIWDLATQKEALTLPKIGAVRALAFDPDGQRLITGGRDGTVKLWNVATGDEIGKTAGHASLVSAVAFAPDGKTIASAGADGTIKVWDAANGNLKLTLTGHESGVYAIDFSPKERRLVSGSWDRTVRVWNLDSGSQVAKLDGHTQDVWSVAYNSEGTLFASTGEDQMIRIWDAATNKEVQSFRGATGAILNVRFSPERNMLIAGTKEGDARMWDLTKLR
jgi:WD40 repeat protein